MAGVETGGPAFPILNDGCQHPRAEGMTLRDYFAIHASDQAVSQAAQQFMARYQVSVCTQEQARYFFADSMLRLRDEAPLPIPASKLDDCPF